MWACPAEAADLTPRNIFIVALDPKNLHSLILDAAGQVFSYYMYQCTMSTICHVCIRAWLKSLSALKTHTDDNLTRESQSDYI